MMTCSCHPADDISDASPILASTLPKRLPAVPVGRARDECDATMKCVTHSPYLSRLTTPIVEAVVLSADLASGVAAALSPFFS
jgi:hypothetical protein